MHNVIIFTFSNFLIFNFPWSCTNKIHVRMGSTGWYACHLYFTYTVAQTTQNAGKDRAFLSLLCSRSSIHTLQGNPASRSCYSPPTPVWSCPQTHSCMNAPRTLIKVSTHTCKVWKWNYTRATVSMKDKSELLTSHHKCLPWQRTASAQAISTAGKWKP